MRSSFRIFMVCCEQSWTALFCLAFHNDSFKPVYLRGKDFGLVLEFAAYSS